MRMARSLSLLVWTLLTACAAAPRTPDLYELLPAPREEGTYVVQAEDPDIDVRIVNVWDAKKSVGTRWIQTRVRELRAPDSERPIWMVSTIHLAERAYWKAIERVLEPAGVILDEGIGSTNADHEEPDRELTYVMRERWATAELTGWVVQSKWEQSISDSRWICVDLDMQEFRALSDDRLDPKQARLGNARLKRMQRLIDGATVDGETCITVRRPMRHKWIMGIETCVDDGSLSMLARFRAANEERDRRALARILAELKKPSHKPLVVLYGAIHTAHFVKALAQHDIVETRPSRWIGACSVEVPALALLFGLRAHQHQPDGADEDHARRNQVVAYR